MFFVFFKKLASLPATFVLAGIRIYQKTLSPDHSVWAKIFFPHGYCKFRPTCSEYGHQAIKKYGLLRGMPKLISRIFRCNPWSRGGEDEA